MMKRNLYIRWNSMAVTLGRIAVAAREEGAENTARVIIEEMQRWDGKKPLPIVELGGALYFDGLPDEAKMLAEAGGASTSSVCN